MTAINTTLIKNIDRWFGGLAINLATVFPDCMQATPQVLRVLIIRPGGIGDAIQLVPVITTFQKRFPEISIDILAEKRNSEAFSFVHGLRTVYCYDSLSSLSSMLCNCYDVVIDTEQWYRLSAVVARVVRAPVKIGFGTNERRRMFTHVIPYSPNAYEADNFLALLKPLGIEGKRGDEPASLEVPHESLAKADQLLQSLCSKPFVVVFPGSSMPEKCWGADRFSSVSRHLEEEGYKVVVVGGREDRADGELIAGAAGLNLAGKTALHETAAVIARARLVICGDSGVLHIAAGLGVPTISLFGPSSEIKWAPRGDNHVVLNHHVPCSPCSRFGTIAPCPINVRCMKEITPEEVVDAARRLLLQPPEQKA